MKGLHLVEAGSAEAEATRLALPEYLQVALVRIAESAKGRADGARCRRALAVSLHELLSRDLSDLELAVVMSDGIELAGMTHVVALAITSDGTKVPLSPREGSTATATVASALLADMVDRGLRLGERQLFVLDGATARRKAVRDGAGARALVQRCQRHQERTSSTTCASASAPGCAQSCAAPRPTPTTPPRSPPSRHSRGRSNRPTPTPPARSGKASSRTLTVTRLGVTGALKRTLGSTNPIESMIYVARRPQRTVTRWRSGDMRIRWTAAGLAEAQRSFQRVKRHRDPPKPQAAIHRKLDPTPTQEPTARIAA